MKPADARSPRVGPRPVVPHFYRSPDEFVAAAKAAVAAAAAASRRWRFSSARSTRVEPGTTARSPSRRLGGRRRDHPPYCARRTTSSAAIGDQLVMVLPGANAEDGRAAGERICAAVRIHDFGEGLGQLTLSVGAASAPEHGIRYERVFEWAARGAASHPGAGQRRRRRRAAAASRGAASSAGDRSVRRPRAGARVAHALARRSVRRPAARRVDRRRNRHRHRDARCIRSNPKFVCAAACSPWLRRRISPFRSRTACGQRCFTSTHRFPTRAATREWHELQHLESVARRAGESGEHHGSASIACSASSPSTFARSRPSGRSSWCSTRCSGPTGRRGMRSSICSTHLDSDRIMICLAHRPDSAFDSSPHRQMLARHDIARELTISRLTRDEVKQWLEAAFHRQQVGREFLAFLYRHTEGNPLFISQLLRVARRRGRDLVQRNRAGNGGRSRSCACPRDARAHRASDCRAFRRARRRCWRRRRSSDVSSTSGCSLARARAANRRCGSRSPKRSPRVCCGRRTSASKADSRSCTTRSPRCSSSRIPRDKRAQLHERVAQSLEKRRAGPHWRDRAALRRGGRSRRRVSLRRRPRRRRRSECTRTRRPGRICRSPRAMRRRRRSSRRFASRWRRSRKPAAATTRSKSSAISRSSGSRARRRAPRADASPDARARANGAGSARARDARGARRSSMPRRSGWASIASASRC